MGAARKLRKYRENLYPRGQARDWLFFDEWLLPEDVPLPETDLALYHWQTISLAEDLKKWGRSSDIRKDAYFQIFERGLPDLPPENERTVRKISQYHRFEIDFKRVPDPQNPDSFWAGMSEYNPTELEVVHASQQHIRGIREAVKCEQVTIRSSDVDFGTFHPAKEWRALSFDQCASANEIDPTGIPRIACLMHEPFTIVLKGTPILKIPDSPNWVKDILNHIGYTGVYRRSDMNRGTIRIDQHELRDLPDSYFWEAMNSVPETKHSPYAVISAAALKQGKTRKTKENADLLIEMNAFPPSRRPEISDMVTPMAERQHGWLRLDVSSSEDQRFRNKHYTGLHW